MCRLPCTYLKGTVEGTVQPHELNTIFQHRLHREPTVTEHARFDHYSYFDVYQYTLRCWLQARAAFVWPATSTVVPVLLLAHNNEDYCRDLLPHLLFLFKQVCGVSGWTPHFYIYENNSTDGTVALLQQLQQRWPMTLCSEQLGNPFAEYSGCNMERSTVRAAHMARLRNSLLGMALPAVVRAPCVFLLDTNVWFPATTLQHLLNILYTCPKVGMATACTTQVDFPSHYYDTYAYTNLTAQASSRQFGCALAGCVPCSRRKSRPLLLPAVTTKQPYWLVSSAFGGLAGLTRHAMVAGLWYSDNNLCEHVHYCQQLQQNEHGVAVVAKAKALWAPMFSDFKDLLPNI